MKSNCLMSGLKTRSKIMWKSKTQLLKVTQKKPPLSSTKGGFFRGALNKWLNE